MQSKDWLIIQEYCLNCGDLSLSLQPKTVEVPVECFKCHQKTAFFNESFSTEVTVELSSDWCVLILGDDYSSGITGEAKTIEEAFDILMQNIKAS